MSYLTLWLIITVAVALMTAAIAWWNVTTCTHITVTLQQLAIVLVLVVCPVLQLALAMYNIDFFFRTIAPTIVVFRKGS